MTSEVAGLVNPASEKPRGRVRWIVCGLLFAATSINYMDRQVLGLLKPLITHDLQWSEIQYSNVVACFTAAYAIGLLLTGRMIDKLGTRIGYAIIMGVWSLSAMSHSLVQTVLGFTIARIMLGLGESGNFPAAIKTTAEWFPQEERSFATGIFNSGANMGAILGPLLILPIAKIFGWRSGFLVTGLFSTTWILIWLFRYRRPDRDRTLSAEELAYIRRQQGEEVAPVKKQTWVSIFCYRQTWAFSIGKFLTDPVWWLYLFWLPDYFSSKYHIDVSKDPMKLIVPLIIVYTCSSVGSIGGGNLPKFFLKRGFSIVGARKAAMLVCAIATVPVVLTVHAGSMWQAIAILSIATAAHQGWSANLFTTASDMFPSSAVGAVVGIGGLMGAVGGVCFQKLTGVILQYTNKDYTIPFLMAGFAYLLGWVILHLLAPRLQKVVL
jgi:ACS family hexuronate transporter-like MFS transporter